MNSVDYHCSNMVIFKNKLVIIKRVYILISLFLFLNSSLTAQQGKIDSLRVILRSPKVKKMTFNDLLKIQKELPNQDKALTIAFADELLSRKDLMAVDSLKAEAFFTISENYRNFGDNNNKVKYYCEESIKLFSKTKNFAKKAQATNMLGVYYANIDDDSTAMNLYTQALQIAEKNNDSIGILRPYMGLTSLFIKMGLYDKALAYGMEGLKLAKRFHNERLMARISNNVANAYYNKGKFDLAISYYKQALTINSKQKDNEVIIRNLSNIGATFLEIQNVDSAAKYLGKAEALLPKIEVPRTFIYTYSAIAKLKNKQNKFKEATIYANKAIQTAKKTQLEGISDEAYSSLVSSYKGLKMPDSALVALENYWKIKERFLETSRNKTVSQVEQQFQNYKKIKEIEIQNAEIALLKKDNTLSETRTKGAIILAILLGILAVLFYNRFRLKKKSSEALTFKNIEIEKQNDLIQVSLSEKETLLREIHHRVKNNLQIISSLLNIQSDNIDDPTLLSNIREGQNRVQAMSLIHQNLYQSEHLSNVDIENYLKELVVYLSEMFEKEGKKIEVEVNANHIEFDIDTAIPLGLIVNELVSNAYKYAFENQENGKIKIDIMALNDIEYELNVNDDGKGLPTDFDPSKSKSLGLKLVKILSKQLRGKFSSSSDKGANFRVLFKDIRAFQLSQK